MLFKSLALGEFMPWPSQGRARPELESGEGLAGQRGHFGPLGLLRVQNCSPQLTIVCAGYVARIQPIPHRDRINGARQGIAGVLPVHARDH